MLTSPLTPTTVNFNAIALKCEAWPGGLHPVCSCSTEIMLTKCLILVNIVVIVIVIRSYSVRFWPRLRHLFFDYVSPIHTIQPFSQLILRSFGVLGLCISDYNLRTKEYQLSKTTDIMHMLPFCLLTHPRCFSCTNRCDDKGNFL